jgi:hypothetical protein
MRLSSNRVMWSIVVGACLEFIVVCSLVPNDSAETHTALQEFLGYTQAPLGRGLFLLFRTGLGHLLVQLPPPLAVAITTVALVAVFVFQSAIMGVPVWIAFQAWRLGRALLGLSEATSNG